MLTAIGGDLLVRMNRQKLTIAEREEQARRRERLARLLREIAAPKDETQSRD